jgi:hypothetical protein
MGWRGIWGWRVSGGKVWGWPACGVGGCAGWWVCEGKARGIGDARGKRAGLGGCTDEGAGLADARGKARQAGRCTDEGAEASGSVEEGAQGLADA